MNVTLFENKVFVGSSHCGTAEMNPTSILEDRVQFLALPSGLRIWHCCELWCGSQTWLGSHVAMAVVWPAATAPIQPLPWKPPHAMPQVQPPKKETQKNTGLRELPSTLMTQVDDC